MIPQGKMQTKHEHKELLSELKSIPKPKEGSGISVHFIYLIYLRIFHKHIVDILWLIIAVNASLNNIPKL